MGDTRLLLSIIRRDAEPQYRRLLAAERVDRVLGLLAEGTAGPGILSLMGLKKEEKILLFAMTRRATASRLMRRMVTDLGINMPGSGIALTLPVGSAGGQSALSYIMGSQEQKSEVSDMAQSQGFPYDLIIAIAESGNVERVMDAARTAGAGGGTMLHAKGVGAASAEKFFGLTLAAEKEMVLILTRHEGKDAIMRAIMDQAGIRTPAHTIVFSLPVEDVAGLRSVMKEESEP